MSNELELLDDDFVKIVKNVIPKEIMEKLPTEEELNLYIKKVTK